MFADVYAIQTVPPSNINRDDTGTPKTAYYGGCLRARVSSQAWKRAMRLYFQRSLDGMDLGVRTKHAVDMVSQAIGRQRPDLAEEAEAMATDVLAIIKVKVEKSKRAGSEKGSPVTQYAVFLGLGEADRLAQVAIEVRDAGDSLSKPTRKTERRVTEAFQGKQALDVALFGRMLADAPVVNTDASAQVAHAISVDEVRQEYDYYTTMDDLAAGDNNGAIMVDTTGFNSSTLYRYATVNVTSLAGQLGDAEATAEGVRAFVEAFVRSMPTGKQNSFANRTLPSAVLVALRDDQPVNAVSAFETPVRPRDGASIAHQAEERLATELERIAEAYGSAPAKAWWTAVDGGGEALAGFGERVGFENMLDAVRDSVLEEVSR